MSSDKIVAIHGWSVPTESGEQILSEEVIERLEELIALIKAGECVGAGAAWVTRDNAIHNMYEYADKANGMISAANMFAYRVMREAARED